MPKNLITKIDQIQKFLNMLKNISESNRDTLLSELKELDLRKFIPEAVNSISQSKMSPENQFTTVELCVILH
jgi:hypothetical protein